MGHPMKALRLLPIVAAAALCAPRPVPPPTKTVPVIDVLHGVEITDAYRWLEDQKSPETRAWIDVQAKVTRDYLSGIPSREAFRRRLTELMNTDTMTSPTVRERRYFFMRRTAAESRGSIWMREGFSGRERQLVDPAKFGEGETYSISVAGVSHDGKLLAFGVRKGGEDETEIRLMDVESGREVAGGLPRGRYFSFEMAPGGRGYYYSRFVVQQGSRVYYRDLKAAGADREIFGEGYGPTESSLVEVSENGRWLLLSVLFGIPPKKVEVYHNVRKGVKYPAVLFITGDADTRVDPSHARKMTALVQASSDSGNPVLLRYDTEGGHTAGANISVERTVEEFADQLAFIAEQTGLTAR